MTGITENAYAKLNISLDVLKRREDGYHDMVMVMQTVSLCDTLTVRETAGSLVRAGTDLSFLPGDERNLAVKAAQVFLRRTGREGTGLYIDIQKRIPVGAGMGGGSADAAAVLRALNRLYGGVLSGEELVSAAQEVGSDVPFCVVGGTRLAKGRGELLTPLPDMPACRYVICKPDFSVSTPELFKKLDRIPRRRHPDTQGILRALEEGDLTQICRRMYNVFEDVNDRRMRTVSEIKSRLLDCGALGAVMTGTGSAVFGVFADTEAAEAAVRSFAAERLFACTAENISSLV